MRCYLGFLVLLSSRISLPRVWPISNFPYGLTRNITSHSMKNLTIHSLLRWEMIILPNSHYTTYAFHFKKLGECTFWTWEWKAWLKASGWTRQADFPYQQEAKAFAPLLSGNGRLPQGTIQEWSFQMSPAASPEILHHTAWRTWLFIAYSDERLIMLPILSTSLIHLSFKGLGECIFWTWEWRLIDVAEGLFKRGVPRSWSILWILITAWAEINFWIVPGVICGVVYLPRASGAISTSRHFSMMNYLCSDPNSGEIFDNFPIKPIYPNPGR